MNPALLLRMTILDISINCYLLIYNAYCSKYNESHSHFARLAVSSLLFSVFGLVTEITVNSTTISSAVNDICHICYFTASLAFGIAYFGYVISLIFPANKAKKYRILVHIISMICFVVMLSAQTLYFQGDGTRYSQGVGPTMCFGIGFLVFLLSDALMIVNFRRIRHSILLSILPISILGTFALIVQIVVPEFLFSESVLTLTSLGVFLAIENPVGKFQDRAFMDLDTHTYNRNCYDYDMRRLTEELGKSIEPMELACVMCDINDLKYVNDNYGHLEGDKKIQAVATALLGEMKTAHKVYRVGGDEFVVLYKHDNSAIIDEEIGRVRRAYLDAGASLAGSLQVAMGYSIKMPNETIDEMVRLADMRMYEDKRRIKAQNET